MYYTIVPFWYTTSQQPLHPRLENPGSATEIRCIAARFLQPGYEIYKNLESLLLQTVNGKNFSEEFKVIPKVYGSDFDPDRLETHWRYNLKTETSQTTLWYWLKELSPAQQMYYSEIVTQVKIILTLPAMKER